MPQVKFEIIIVSYISLNNLALSMLNRLKAFLVKRDIYKTRSATPIVNKTSKAVLA